jgi:hypothetical protein
MTDELEGASSKYPIEMGARNRMGVGFDQLISTPSARNTA